MQMTNELTVIKSKDIDNIDVHTARVCFQNTPISKEADNNRPLFKEVPSRHVLACCCLTR